MTTKMPLYVWSPEQSIEEQKDGAYWERNMLALMLAHVMPNGGWYYGEPRYDGWSRVISIASGTFTFHVPDAFDLGTLPQIAPNWDGHTTEAKWNHAMLMCGIQTDLVQCSMCGVVGPKEQMTFSVWDGVVYDNPADPDYDPRCASCLAKTEVYLG